MAVVEFLNSPANLSSRGEIDLHHDDLTVYTTTVINVNSAGAERFIVHPPQGWVAVPQSIDVFDGHSGTVVVHLGSFQGM